MASFEKLKNSFSASFQAKMGQKRLRKRENKKYHSSRPYPIRNRKFQKNSKTTEKIKKIPLWLYFNPKSVGKS